MKYTNNLIRKLDTIIESPNATESLRAISREVHPAILANRLEERSAEEIYALLEALDMDARAYVLSHFSKNTAGEVAALYSNEDLADIIERMAHDDRVDLIRNLPEVRREPLLSNVSEEEREDILKLIQYPEHYAGSLMTSDFVRLRKEMTVAEALNRIRYVAKDRETIYYTYVVDSDGVLNGIISLKNLILSNPDSLIADVMYTEVVSVRVDEEREEVARQLSSYELIAVPVVDHSDRLVGIITFDDVMQVQEEEATIDFHKMGSVGLMDISLRDAPVSMLFIKRIPWLLILVFMNIFSGAGIAYFEDTIEAVVALVFFLPLLIDSGGNAGSQASTLMVRALATGDVRIRDWLRLFGKEILVALSIGLAMALAVSFIGFFRAGTDVAIVVSITMVCCVVTGSLLGMSLPFLLQKLKFDPATASAPLITSVADISGVLMYFGIATWYLGVGG